MPKKDYYEVLGISREATEDEIKKAYKKAALKWHPDKNPDNKEKAEVEFKKIAEAMSVLGDSDKKSQYDQFGTTDDMPPMMRRGGGGAGMHGEMSPEELFQMFFGNLHAGGMGGMGGNGMGGIHFRFGSNGRMYSTQSSAQGPRPQRREASPAREPTIGDALRSLLPLLPIILLFFLTFSSSSSPRPTDPRAYSLHQTNEFSRKRVTSVEKVSYYVRPDFRLHVEDRSALQVLEAQIARAKKADLELKCQDEKRNHPLTHDKWESCGYLKDLFGVGAKTR
jgi:curved DNA-binding protein CbpA